MVRRSGKGTGRRRTGSSVGKKKQEDGPVQQKNVKSEYKNFISSLLDLKSGKVEKFNELISKVTEAKTNIWEGFISGMKNSNDQWAERTVRVEQLMRLTPLIVSWGSNN